MSHHRQHAIEFLEESQKRLESARGSLVYYLDGIVLSEEQQTQFESVLRYIDRGLVQVNKALTEAPCGDLDEIRRFLSQPRMDTGDGVANSALIVTAVALNTYRKLHGVGDIHPDGNRAVNFDNGMRAIKVAWTNLDLAVWHIVDAIREEIYQDPNFAS